MKKSKRDKKSKISAKINEEEKDIKEIAREVSPLLEDAVQVALEDEKTYQHKKTR